jgi:hypothetical protein
MSEQVYAVTSGEYSDYRVDAVYLDRSLADQHAAMYPAGDHGQVKTYPVRTVLPTKAMRISRYFRKNTGKHDVYERGPDLVFAEQLKELDSADYGDSIMVEGYDRALVDVAYGERVARFKAAQGGLA